MNDNNNMVIDSMDDGDAAAVPTQSSSVRATQTTCHEVWNSLVEWICRPPPLSFDPTTATTDNNNNNNGKEESVGIIHPALELRESLNFDGTDDAITNQSAAISPTYRGVFASRPIAKGELLMQVPLRLAIHGDHLPVRYTKSNNNNKNNNNNLNKASGNSTTATTTTKNTQQQQLQHASPWLRCLAALYQAQQAQSSSSSSLSFWSPYLQSLPSSYETVATSWTADQVASFLAGTSTQGGSHVAWQPLNSNNDNDDNDDNNHNDPLRERYVSQIRPYLVQQGCLPPRDTATIPSTSGKDEDDNNDTVTNNSGSISDEEWQQFVQASACLSTRGFHLQGGTKHAHHHSDDDTAQSRTNVNPTIDSSDYTGPFLLPAIDLLNHAARGEPGHVTTLHRSVSSSSCFTLVAERDIAAHEEILHSYGDTLTAGQLLQTFGFVPVSKMQQIVILWLQYHEHQQQGQPELQPVSSSNDDDGSNRRLLQHLSPALLRKQDVLEACWGIIESDIPTVLSNALRDLEDEVWTVTVDRTRTANDFISDDLIVDAVTPLSDEIVTAACIPFLPICAYREAASALLDDSILEDLFLGYLVCTSLCRVIQTKLAQYTNIRWQGQEYSDDIALLQQLLHRHQQLQQSKQQNGATSRLSTEEWRLAYGLTLRLEEKFCLHALRRTVMDKLAKLEEDLPFEYQELRVSKKQKMEEK